MKILIIIKTHLLTNNLFYFLWKDIEPIWGAKVNILNSLDIGPYINIAVFLVNRLSLRTQLVQILCPIFFIIFDCIMYIIKGDVSIVQLISAHAWIRLYFSCSIHNFIAIIHSNGRSAGSRPLLQLEISVG